MATFEKVYFQKNYRVGEFQYNHYGIGLLLNPNEDPKEAMKEAEKFVHEYFLETVQHEHIETRNIDVPLPEIQVGGDKRPLEEQIMSCETVEQLENFSWALHINEKYELAYNKKMYIFELEKK